MTLDEAFEIYKDDKLKLRRSSYRNYFEDCDYKSVAEHLKNGGGAYSIEWLKSMKSWAKSELATIGFMIPKSMIEDANTHDWELAN